LKPNELDLDRYLPYLINRIGSSVAAAFAADIAEEKITISMWRVLAALYHAGEQKQIDLARLTSIVESTLSRVVSALHQRNLVAKARSEKSGRELSIDLTDEGRKLSKRFIPLALKYQILITHNVSEKDLEVVRRCLRQFYENLRSRPPHAR